MEATALSVGKAVLHGALGYAKSFIAEEIALQLGVERDVIFIGDELEMMQSFLMTAHEERDKHKVLLTWVKQVRETAYNVEDNLMDFAAHSDRKPFCWCIPRNLWERRSIAKEVKELRTKVEDVSNRNLRYRLIKGTGSNLTTTAEEQANVSSVATFVINEARHTAEQQENSKVDLFRLITNEDKDLRVIAVWGSSSGLGKTSSIREAYEHQEVYKMFGCRAWVTVTSPFNSNDFFCNLLRQFFVYSHEVTVKSIQGRVAAYDVLKELEKMEQSYIPDQVLAYVDQNRYLIVIDGLSTMVEWDWIKTYLPDKKNGSRIILSKQQVEIASLCTEQPYQVTELNQLSSDQSVYLFHNKIGPMPQDTMNTDRISSVMSSSSSQIHNEAQGSMVGSSSYVKRKLDVNSTMLIEPMSRTTVNNDGRNSSSNYSSSEIEKDEPPIGSNGTKNQIRKLDRTKTLEVVDEDIVGRANEKSVLINLLIEQADSGPSCKVISAWGMGGIGKTTLVRSVCQSQQLGVWKRAWVRVLRPFNHISMVRSLVSQLQKTIHEDPSVASGIIEKKKTIAVMGPEELMHELTLLLEKQKCLIVVDDLSSIEEWDSVKRIFEKAHRIIVTTRENFVAKYCSKEDKNMYNLQGLEDNAAFNLFKKKVFKGIIDFDLHPGMVDQAIFILKKCNRLPLAISTIAGFLADRPKTIVEWRKLNDNISAELEINPELRMIKAILMRSFDGLPYHLKSSFLYMSVFPEDHKIRRTHLVRRWIAEGYSKEMHGMNEEEVTDKYFDELISRSMILPGESENYHIGKYNYCQLHDVIREICVSKAREENLVFTLEEGCNLSGNQQGVIRHLAISSSWKRDKHVLDHKIDLSHLRSLTVFGEWRSYMISGKMRFLRVLDLEGTTGLRSHHLDQIRELLHLRFLNLRGCQNIFQLPDSIGKLRHLQTLDVRGTSVWRLPTTITTLQKLQHVCCGSLEAEIEGSIFDKFERFMQHYDTSKDEVGVMVPLQKDDMMSFSSDELLEEKRRLLFLRCRIFFLRCRLFFNLRFKHSRHKWKSLSRLFRILWKLYKDGLSRNDVLNLYRFSTMRKKLITWQNGVILPRGFRNLKALEAMGVVDVEWGQGNGIIMELEELTQLRKLRVTGVHHKNSGSFWSAIACHNQLRSLSVQSNTSAAIISSEEDTSIDVSFCDNLSPPKGLESLKLHAELSKLSEWIHGLPNLTKLQLEETYLEQDDIHAIGRLPNLVVLRMQSGSYEGMRFSFQGLYFPSLVVLELSDIKSLRFSEQAMPNLELLQVTDGWHVEELSGLLLLTSLREICFDGYLRKEMKEKVPSLLSGSSVQVTWR